MPIDATHSPHLRSWVESANDPATDFPIQNLPLCCFMAEHDGHAHPHHGVAIGDQVLDVSMLAESGYFDEGDDSPSDLNVALYMPYWSGVLGMPELWGELRSRLQEFLSDTPAGGQSGRRLRQKAVRPIRGTRFLRPASIRNYTDFYASIHHATNVGRMFRPDTPLLPNYKHVPIGYHGRASSVIAGEREIRRPRGQTKADDAAAPTFGPCAMLDYELEVGAVVGEPNPMGEAVAIARAREHLYGLVLVNDWSARDIQKWEYQPLGPFLAKNFATSISPFIVPMAALEPFRCEAEARPAGDPRPLEYLYDEDDQRAGGFDITLEASLLTAEMERRGMQPHRLSSGNFRHMYWTFAQMLAHHTSNGCAMECGDLIASGTVSGPTPESRGCLLELTWDGAGPDGKPKPRKPIQLPTGEARTFLQDGDSVILRGFCEREGFRRIGFGACRGTIAPAG